MAWKDRKWYPRWDSRRGWRPDLPLRSVQPRLPLACPVILPCSGSSRPAAAACSLMEAPGHHSGSLQPPGHAAGAGWALPQGHDTCSPQHPQDRQTATACRVPDQQGEEDASDTDWDDDCPTFRKNSSYKPLAEKRESPAWVSAGLAYSQDKYTCCSNKLYSKILQYKLPRHS